MEEKCLKEKIIYKDELPINVVTANIEEYPIHFHDDMEVVYVLEGSVHPSERILYTIISSKAIFSF